MVRIYQIIPILFFVLVSSCHHQQKKKEQLVQFELLPQEFLSGDKNEFTIKIKGEVFFVKTNRKKNWYKLKVKKKEAVFGRKKFQLFLLEDSVSIEWAKQTLVLNTKLRANNQAAAHSFIQEIAFIDGDKIPVLFREYPEDAYLEHNKRKEGFVFSFTKKGEVKYHHRLKEEQLSVELVEQAWFLVQHKTISDEYFKSQQVRSLLKTLKDERISAAINDFLFYLNPMENKLELMYFPIHNDSNKKVEFIFQSTQKEDLTYQNSFTAKTETVLSPKQTNTVISSIVKIPAGKELVLFSGQQLTFENGGGLIVYGSIRAEGSEKDSIKIIGRKGNLGLHVLNSTGVNRMKYVKCEGLSNFQQNNWLLPGAITFYNSEVQLLNSTFSENKSEDAVHFFNCVFTCENISFNQCQSDALDIDFSSGTITGLTANRIGNDALDLSGSTIILKDFYANSVGDKAISVGEQSELTGQKFKITNSSIGVAVKDSSLATVSEVTFNQNELLFAVYQKKETFGPAKLIVNNYKSDAFEDHDFTEKKSILVLDGKVQKGRISNVVKYLK